MNLSKIATGIVASFCLVSNVVSAGNLSFNDKLVERLIKVSGNDAEAKAIREILKEDGIVLVDEEDIFQYTSKPDYSVAALLNDELNKEVNNLEKVINKNKDDHQKLIQANTKAISTEKTRIDNNKTLIIKNKENIDTNKKLITGNTELITAHKKVIDSNKASIANNQRLISENTASITGNQKLIAQNTAKITLNHQAIQKLTTDLMNLKTALKRGLATQSALNGLFQPYSVGKFNLTAAFGGYQSQTAIAIGTGYRFNERIAAKAGIAKSVKGAALSYNVGVNYEF
ncbi:TPA: YadA-like family protein [Pasteurella multocida]|nr:YadA-like family protein [Pasteurella multocida]